MILYKSKNRLKSSLIKYLINKEKILEKNMSLKWIMSVLKLDKKLISNEKIK
jgi:hypothetical protein